MYVSIWEFNIWVNIYWTCVIYTCIYGVWARLWCGQVIRCGACRLKGACSEGWQYLGAGGVAGTLSDRRLSGSSLMHNALPRGSAEWLPSVILWPSLHNVALVHCSEGNHFHHFVSPPTGLFVWGSVLFSGSLSLLCVCVCVSACACMCFVRVRAYVCVCAPVYLAAEEFGWLPDLNTCSQTNVDLTWLCIHCAVEHSVLFFFWNLHWLLWKRRIYLEDLPAVGTCLVYFLLTASAVTLPSR